MLLLLIPLLFHLVAAVVAGSVGVVTTVVVSAVGPLQAILFLLVL
jgi:hypothetical protein